MRCIICNTELSNDQDKCPTCGLILKKENTEERDIGSKPVVLKKEELNNINELLIKKDKNKKQSNLNKKNKTKNNIDINNVKLKDDSSTKNESIKSNESIEDDLVRDIERISKELEVVNKSIIYEKDKIDNLREEEKKKKQRDKIDKILTNDHIDMLASAITDEIVEGINAKNELDKKNQSFNVDLSKTIAISPQKDLSDLNNISLIDDINKQIDMVNQEVEKTDEDETGAEIAQDTYVSYDKEDIKDTIKSRKRILLFTGIAVLVLIITLVALWLITTPFTKKEVASVDYVQKINSAMNDYYKTNDLDDVLLVLEEVKNNKEAVKKIQSKTRVICDSWVLLYFDEEAKDKNEFEEVTSRYKNLLEGLYRYAIVKNDTNLVRALTEKDYNDLSIQFDNIYSDSSLYYEALELYNDKDYNKAYYIFDRIDSTNSYYDKSVSYAKKIINNILEAMKEDINKIETGIELLDDSGKLEKYSNIEQIIIDYNGLYVYIDLSDNEIYQSLLGKYTSKVSEYTEKVLNDDPQGSVSPID